MAYKCATVNTAIFGPEKPLAPVPYWNFSPTKKSNGVRELVFNVQKLETRRLVECCQESKVELSSVNDQGKLARPCLFAPFLGLAGTRRC